MERVAIIFLGVVFLTLATSSGGRWLNHKIKVHGLQNDQYHKIQMALSSYGEILTKLQ